MCYIEHVGYDAQHVQLHIMFTNIVAVLYWFLAVLVCGRFCVWPFWSRPFWFMAVLDVNRVNDTRDTCAVSRYFVLLRYTAVHRDLGDTGIVA